jgi:hypothetical protein
MQIWIDSTQLADSSSIEEAFELARKHAEETGRLIIDIQADGQPIDDSLLDNPPTDSAGIEEIRLTTTDFNAFLTETVESAKEALALTQEDQNTAADLLRSGELEQAMTTIGAVLAGWQAVRDVFAQTAALADIDVDTITADSKTGSQCAESLSVALKEVRSALETQDWSSLGDAIDCDLDDQATLWNLLLDNTIERVKSPG